MFLFMFLTFSRRILLSDWSGLPKPERRRTFLLRSRNAGREHGEK
jgi:hypothetical protein